MAEKGEGPRPKIVVNARGEEREVPPASGAGIPKEEPKTEKPESEASRRVGEFVKGAVAGAAAGEAIEELGKVAVNKGMEAVRKVAYGTGERKKVFGIRGEEGEVPPGKPPESSRGNEEDPMKKAAFSKVLSMSNDKALSDSERQKWIDEKNLRIEDFRKFDDGDFVADTARSFQNILRTGEWDPEGGKGVYDRLVAYADEREGIYKDRHEAEDRLKGIISIAIRAEAARTLVAGIENKFEGLSEDDRADWLRTKHYTDSELERLRRIATENHIFDFATDAPEELVGASLEKEVAMKLSITDETKTMMAFMERLTQFFERSLPPAPEKQRLTFFDYEESGEAVLEIPPLTSNIWEGLSNEEKLFWRARLLLSNARAKKQAANLETFTDNPEIMKQLSKESLDLLTNRKGVAEAVAIYTVFIANPEFFEDRNGNPIKEMRARMGMTKTRLYSVSEPKMGFVDRIKIRLTGKRQYEEKTRRGVADQTDLKQFRNEFRGYLLSRFSLSNEDEARTVEQIAYNFVYMTNLAEECDHSGDPRLPNVINEGLRDAMHPRSKMLDAISTGTGDRWPPNVLGGWGWVHRRELLSDPNKVPLTDQLFPSFLSWKNVMGRDTDKKRGATFKEFLINEGKALIDGKKDSTKINWFFGARSDLNDPIGVEAPFGRYMAVQIGRGSVVVNTLLTGEPPRGKTTENLQNAFRSLGTVGERMRRVLIYLIYNQKENFIRPRDKYFAPHKNPFYLSGLRDRINTEYPGYFD